MLSLKSLILNGLILFWLELFQFNIGGNIFGTKKLVKQQLTPSEYCGCKEAMLRTQTVSRVHLVLTHHNRRNHSLIVTLRKLSPEQSVSIQDSRASSSGQAAYISEVRSPTALFSSRTKYPWVIENSIISLTYNKTRYKHYEMH